MHAQVVKGMREFRLFFENYVRRPKHRALGKLLRHQGTLSLSLLSLASQLDLTYYDFVRITTKCSLSKVRLIASPHWVHITYVFWWKCVLERSKKFTTSCFTWNCKGRVFKLSCNEDLSKRLSQEQRFSYLQFYQKSKRNSSFLVFCLKGMKIIKPKKNRHLYQCCDCSLADVPPLRMLTMAMTSLTGSDND